MDSQGLIAPDSVFEISVPEIAAGRRIDKFITTQFPLYSRTFFNRLIDDGHISLNGEVVSKASTIVDHEDLITVHFPPARDVQVDALARKAPAVEVIFEHPHFMIVYKPEGLLVHPPSMASTAATLVDWLLVHFNDIKDVGYVDRPGIVHRLDKDTSGLLVIPRTNYAHSVFGTHFRNRTIHKRYYAVVQGLPDKEGVIDAAIGRDPVTKTRMTTTTHPGSGMKMRDSQTHYRVVEYFDDAALLEVKPITGRTHQIRVHLASIGYPIIGDPVYGKKSKLIDRQALHAFSLAFDFDGQAHSFQKDVPADFKQLIESLRNSSQK